MDPTAAVPGDVHVDLIELFQPGPHKVAIVDPTLKHCGLLWVPRQHISPSKALKRITGQEQMPPSLCQLFQKGQCRADQRCNQLHVSPDFIRALRRAMAAVPYSNCCLGHGDLPSQRREFRALLAAVAVVLARNGAPDVTLPPTSVSMTLFWRPFMEQQARAENAALRFSAARVCRLHQRGVCKFGVDCNNIHICREFWASQRRPSSDSPSPCTPVSETSPYATEAGSLQRLFALSSRCSLSAASAADPLDPRPRSPNPRSPPAVQSPPPHRLCPPGTPTPRLPPPAPSPGLWNPPQPLCYLCIPVLVPSATAAPTTPLRPPAAPAADASPPFAHSSPSLSGVARPGPFLATLLPGGPPPRQPVHVASANSPFSPLDGLRTPSPPFCPPAVRCGADLPDMVPGPSKLKHRFDLQGRAFPPPVAVAPVPPCPPMGMRPIGTPGTTRDITVRGAAGQAGDEVEQRTMLAALPATLLADL